jgi:hypothetical protein
VNQISQRQWRSARWAALLALLSLAGAPAFADDWVMHMTVDNEYDVYFGDALATDYHAGGDSNWQTTETWHAYGRDPGDYLYVATASDHFVAQGFLGDFTNTTLGSTIETGNSVWQVFPAGKYWPLINPSWPNPWPAWQMPTQAQVDQAIAYAETHGLWGSPTQVPGYDNSSNPPPWQNRPGISPTANWIWYNSGKDPGGGTYPVPFNGFNHDEFLVFRVPNIAPEPSTLALLLVGLAALRRR